MRKTLWKYVLAIIIPVIAYAGTPDRDLALLRGSWKYMTYDDHWNLAFLDDSYLTYQGILLRYSLAGNCIRVVRDDTDQSWPYRFENGALAVGISGEKPRVFRREETGAEESWLVGFYTSMGPDDGAEVSPDPAPGSLEFNGGNTFSYTGRAEPGDRARFRSPVTTGLYRVSGDEIILVYDDGTSDAAVILSREATGRIDGISFRGYYYAVPHIIVVDYPDPIPRPDPGPYPPPPPPRPRPEPPPPPIPLDPPVDYRSPQTVPDHSGDRRIGESRTGAPPAEPAQGERNDGRRRGK